MVDAWMRVAVDMLHVFLHRRGGMGMGAFWGGGQGERRRAACWIGVIRVHGACSSLPERLGGWAYIQVRARDLDEMPVDACAGASDASDTFIYSLV
jgi:hypothetical protein